MVLYSEFDVNENKIAEYKCNNNLQIKTVALVICILIIIRISISIVYYLTNNKDSNDAIISNNITNITGIIINNLTKK